MLDAILLDLQYSRQLYMPKGTPSKYADAGLFTFSNTPQTSNNVSFQYNFNSNTKSNYNDCSLLKDNNFSQLFNSSNKENEQWKYTSNRLQDSINKPTIKTNDGRGKSGLRETPKNTAYSIKIDLSASMPNGSEKRHSLKNSDTIAASLKLKRDGSAREENIKVYIRLKPKNEKESSDKESAQIINDQTIKIDQSYFCFDEIFRPSTDQETIFKQIGYQMCQSLFQGYNGTIFAYGQTGSGKTYTIFGQESLQNHGLIYRCIREILRHRSESKANLKVKCSMVQLYKEQLIDMFGSGQTELRLKQDKNGGVYIEGLKETYIQNETEMMNLVRNAAKSRKVTATKINEESSRSHTILSIYLQSQKYSTKLCLIDLAGSQKVCKSGTRGEAFEQTKKINYSLSCLGNVINALTTRNKSEHIPFRDSKLTRILKDSLTGNFITSVIVNCSTAEQSLHETVSSLKFAERAKKIKINVQSLEEQSIEKGSIEQLHEIIKRLQCDLESTTNQLQKYKQAQLEKPPKSQQSNHKKIVLCCPSNPDEGAFTRKQAVYEEINGSEQGLTARNPIPSERALVDEHIQRYKLQKAMAKPHQFLNNLNINNFSSLNVSKSIKRAENSSPDISSLSFKYDESPDLSLSFSIRGDSAQRQLLFNSPL